MKTMLEKLETLKKVSKKEEEWKLVPGTNDNYFASNLGRIYKFKTSTFHTSSEGFVKVLSRNQDFAYKSFTVRYIEAKTFNVKNVVAELFLAVDLNQYKVELKDGDPLNCAISNLEVIKRKNQQKKINTIFYQTDELPDLTEEDIKEYLERRKRAGLFSESYFSSAIINIDHLRA